MKYIEVNYLKCTICTKNKTYKFKKEDIKLLKFNLSSYEFFIEGDTYIYIVPLEKAILDMEVEEV